MPSQRVLRGYVGDVLFGRDHRKQALQSGEPGRLAVRLCEELVGVDAPDRRPRGARPVGDRRRHVRRDLVEQWQGQLHDLARHTIGVPKLLDGSRRHRQAGGAGPRPNGGRAPRPSPARGRRSSSASPRRRGGRSSEAASASGLGPRRRSRDRTRAAPCRGASVPRRRGRHRRPTDRRRCRSMSFCSAASSTPSAASARNALELRSRATSRSGETTGHAAFSTRSRYPPDRRACSTSSKLRIAAPPSWEYSS